MTTTKHTPGPWEGTPQAKGRDYAITLNVNRKEVGFAVMWGNESPEAAQARIALISAAPELLGAARSMLALLVEMGADDGSRGEKLKAAIAKAEGR